MAGPAEGRVPAIHVLRRSHDDGKDSSTIPSHGNPPPPMIGDAIIVPLILEKRRALTRPRQ
jgi:hypothetical protein